MLSPTWNLRWLLPVGVLRQARRPHVRHRGVFALRGLLSYRHRRVRDRLGHAPPRAQLPCLRLGLAGGRQRRPISRCRASSSKPTWRTSGCRSRSPSCSSPALDLNLRHQYVRTRFCDRAGAAAGASGCSRCRRCGARLSAHDRFVSPTRSSRSTAAPRCWSPTPIRTAATTCTISPLVHAACLAIIERSALVTTAFTVVGKQILHVRPEYRARVDTEDGTPPMIDELVEQAEHPDAQNDQLLVALDVRLRLPLRGVHRCRFRKSGSGASDGHLRRRPLRALSHQPAEDGGCRRGRDRRTDSRRPLWLVPPLRK